MKIKRFFKNNILGFIIGAILFGGIGYATASVVASSSIEYTNNSQTTVESALNDLYTKAFVNDETGIISSTNYGVVANYYTNINGFSGNSSNVYPYSNCRNASVMNQYKVFTSRKDFINWYGASNFAEYPIYIKTSFVGSTLLGSGVCLFYNNKELCISKDHTIYPSNNNQAGAFSNLVTYINQRLGTSITSSDCNAPSSSSIECTVGDFTIGIGIGTYAFISKGPNHYKQCVSYSNGSSIFTCATSSS